MDRTPLPAAHAAALRRAYQLTGELIAMVAAVRTGLAELEVTDPAADEGGLPEGEFRAAFAAAREAPGAERRRRWADTLLRET
jgi:hypothetical protein